MSHKFKEIFGDMGGGTAKRWTNNDIILANGTRIIAEGTGQRVRGFIEGDTRPNLIIIDELNDFKTYEVIGRILEENKTKGVF